MNIIHRPRISREKFASILDYFRSPAAPVGDICYDICVAYGIDPAIALAFFRKESTFGTAGVAVQTQGWGNMRRAHVKGHGIGSTEHPFAIYPDWQTSLLDWCIYVHEYYVQDRGLQTVAEILPIYAPSFENNTQLYIRQIETWVQEWSDMTDEHEPTIEWVGMTRPHYQAGGNARRAVVIHSTAGRYPGDYNWLRQGGSAAEPVSVHYYITKTGELSQMVKDTDTAWHAGQSTWIIDGKQVPMATGLNPYSLGIELENLNNGSDPYPLRQLDACVWLCQRLVQQYDIPQSQLVRHLDIAPGRKSDPAGFPWEDFVASVYADSEPEYRAPHWYAVVKPTTNIRYTPEVTPDNIAMQIREGRMHIAEWLPETDPEYGGRWGRLSMGGFVHITGVVAE